MPLRRFALASLFVSLAASTAVAQSPQLANVLSQLDAASAKFKSAQASVKYDNFTKIVREDEKQNGTLYIERVGSGQRFGAAFYNLGADGQPSKTADKIINYDGGTLQVYSPGTGTDDVFKAGANQSSYESFLTLGFGGSGKALAQSWNITDQGQENIGSVSTRKLDLVSKDPSVVSKFSHVTIWLDPTRGVSLKQIFYAPNGDTRTAEYSDIKLNNSINKAAYNIPSKSQKNIH
jgi:outer membrane lipoprotein-sorting protein